MLNSLAMLSSDGICKLAVMERQQMSNTLVGQFELTSPRQPDNVDDLIEVLAQLGKGLVSLDVIIVEVTFQGLVPSLLQEASGNVAHAV